MEQATTSESDGSAAPWESVRHEVRAWLNECWDPDLTLREWRDVLADSGWGCPTWPAEWFGRGLEESAASIVIEELERIGAPGVAYGSGMTLAAPTILEHGSNQLKSELLRSTLTGEYRWCQLFSEPGSGSDLAGLTAKAERDGDYWIVSGQKLWCTSADHADYGMLLARTDWDVPKHRGITYFALPMHQAGVEVRPLRQMNGYASFNEVFLTEARVPVANVVGEVNTGWRVALTTLAHERAATPGRADPLSGRGRAVREAEEERRSALKPYVWYPARGGRPDLLVERARRHGRNNDPIVRQEVAQVLALARAVEWTRERADAIRALGQAPGPEASVRKLGATRLARAASRAHGTIGGAAGMLWPDDDGGSVAEITLSVPAASIAAGTDEIQRTIIGERVLGLPKDPVSDRDVPFSETSRNGHAG